MIVTPFCNFQICVVLRRGENPPCLLLGPVDVSKRNHRLSSQKGLHRGDHIPVAACAQQTVHLGHLLQDLPLIALRQASGHQNFPHCPGLFQLAHGNDIVNGL